MKLFGLSGEEYRPTKTRANEAILARIKRILRQEKRVDRD